MAWSIKHLLEKGMFKMPFFVKWALPKAVFKLPRKQNTVYLTFDDGPCPKTTPKVLEILDEFDIKATFFCLGENIEKHQEIFELIQQKKHALANHGYAHLNGFKTDLKTYLNNVKKGEKLTKSKLFRPPFGKISRRQYNALKSNLSIVLWDVISWDFSEKFTASYKIKQTLKSVENGSILLFHDSAKSDVLDILPAIVKTLKSKGFHFEKL